MKSKLDVYKVLTKEGQYYLPPYTECTMDFMADVIQGKKKVSEGVGVIERGFVTYLHCCDTVLLQW